MSYSPKALRARVELALHRLTADCFTIKLPENIALVGVEPTPSPYKEDALNHLSFRARLPMSDLNSPSSRSKRDVLPTTLIGTIGMVRVELTIS